MRVFVVVVCLWVRGGGEGAVELSSCRVFMLIRESGVIYIYMCVCVCMCVYVCVCVYHLSLCVSLLNIAGDFFGFLNDTCMYAFVECREACDFVSEEVCSHARAGVLA